MIAPSSEHAPQSYLIRGHHFSNILQAYGPHVGATGVAKDLVLTMDAFRRDATSADVNFALLDLPELPMNQLIEYEKAYAIDMIGDTPEQAARVQQLTEAAMSRFQRLAKDNPVAIGVGILDAQCNSCIFQRHCRNTGELSLKPDYDSLNIIQSVIQHLGLATQSVVSGIGADLASYKLTTNADTMHKVVNFFQDINHEDPQLPFIKAAYGQGFELFSR
jgi:hypothetical protein